MDNNEKDDLMICEKCGKNHDGSYGSGRFCSMFCAKSHIVGYGKKIIKSKPLKETVARRALSLMRRNREIMLQTNTELLAHVLRKRKVLEEQGFKCCICGMPFIWEGEELVSQLHHIDGDSKNNLRVNLQVLCPNCHSQTKTHSIKKKRRVHQDVM